jgi:hypothetical protein
LNLSESQAAKTFRGLVLSLIEAVILLVFLYFVTLTCILVFISLDMLTPGRAMWHDIKTPSVKLALLMEAVTALIMAACFYLRSWLVEDGMGISACDVPASSALGGPLLETAYFQDSYCAPASEAGAGIVDIFLAIFAHHPWWMKAILLVRNRLVALWGISAPAASEVINFDVRNTYAVGDKIGVWPIFSLTENELVAGRDNKHLDFRLSVLKITEGGTRSVTVSTVCTVHNTFGKIYLFFIVPFHKWGVRHLLFNAIAAGRL